MDYDNKMEILNLAKQQVFGKLYKDEKITLEEAKELDERYQFVIFKPKWYQNWFKKTDMYEANMDMEGYHLRLIDIRKPNGEDENNNGLFNFSE